MRSVWVCAILCCLFIEPTWLDAQGFGEDPTEFVDIECPTGLNNDPQNGLAVDFEGQSYITQWFPVRVSRPLSSYELYRPPTSTPNLTSTDGKARWMAASIFVHCWVERNPYFVRRHYDIVDYGGYTVLTTANCGKDAYRLVDDQDPYDPYDGPDCAGSGSGGGGQGAGGACHQEYVVVEISYDNGATWSVYWEGYATVCE
jgi:hypothetical protein